ncbi:sigma-70 family RNA polymerase sigma factor [Isosphaeraceae bacterium EP7]
MAPQSFEDTSPSGGGLGYSARPGTAARERDGGTGSPRGDVDFDRLDWDRFYADCNAVIVAALARQPIQPADREDCRQQIWVELLTSRMSGFRGGNLPAWLTTLARNRAIDKARRARRHPVELPRLEREGASAESSESSPAQQAEAVVRVALDQLEKEIESLNFAIFVLHSIDGLSFGQIAGALSLTPDQARARNHRTKAKFRRIVEMSGAHGQVEGEGRDTPTRALGIAYSPRSSHRRDQSAACDIGCSVTTPPRTR